MALCRQTYATFGIFYKARCLSLATSRSISFFKHKSKDQEMELPDTLTDKRKHKSGQDNMTMKENLYLLKTHGKLDTKKEYRAPSDVEARIKEMTTNLAELSDHTSWDQVSLKDPNFKYEILTQFMKAFDHSIPNTELTKMQTVSDAVDFFQKDVKLTHSLEDLSKLDLPKNLHIQLEYLRFDPETDTMFGGKTALPGSDSVVKSIKYKRKYQTIKTTEEKPGYVNHYYGY